MEKKYHHGDLKNALIAAGIAVLAEEGVHGLSLRKVAQRAGVSHAAPYAHYADKQALIAAISTEGYRRLYETLRAVGERHAGDPLRQLFASAWAYVQFAQRDPAHFKITFSGVVEKEHAYPAFVEMSRKSFDLVVQMVAACQAQGILKPGEPDLVAVSVWGLVHGVVSLLLEGQISHTVRDRHPPRELLMAALNQVLCVELTPELIAEVT
jgi:AcrR family transcriptional regulator